MNNGIPRTLGRQSVPSEMKNPQIEVKAKVNFRRHSSLQPTRLCQTRLTKTFQKTNADRQQTKK